MLHCFLQHMGLGHLLELQYRLFRGSYSQEFLARYLNSYNLLKFPIYW